MLRTLPACFLLYLLLVPGPSWSAQDEEASDTDTRHPSIGEVSVVQTDGMYVASFRMDSAFDPEILGKIDSGLETIFDYRLEVLRRRRFWIDERTVQHKILASTRYDSLSRQYNLMLKVDGEVERSSTTNKPEEMRRWMTEIQGIVLGPISGFVPAEEFTVRVKSNLQQRFVLLFIPWERDTPWARVPLLAGSADLHGNGE